MTWAPVMHGPAPDQNIEVASPNRSFCMDEFQMYEEGKGGCCAGFTPAEGYWCSSKTSGGGAFTYRIPSGVTVGERNHAKILVRHPRLSTGQIACYSCFSDDVRNFHACAILLSPTRRTKMRKGPSSKLGDQVQGSRLLLKNNSLKAN
eukprot:SAG31_NODE_1971_length_6758_cov_3.905205_7_plen_148_part_00